MIHRVAQKVFEKKFHRKITLLIEEFCAHGETKVKIRKGLSPLSPLFLGEGGGRCRFLHFLLYYLTTIFNLACPE